METETNSSHPFYEFEDENDHNLHLQVENNFSNQTQTTEEVDNSLVAAEYIGKTAYTKITSKEKYERRTMTIAGHHGFIQKKSPSLMRLWQTRFFVIDDHKFKWFRSEISSARETPLGSINFNIHECTILRCPTNRNKFTV